MAFGILDGATGVVGMGVFQINLDRSGQVGDAPVVVALFIIGIGAV